jgi:tetratricopeptide (TPR) repeat protein
MKRRIPITYHIFLAALVLISSIAGCSDKSLKYYNLGVSAAEREEFDQAIEYWRESLKHRSNDPETRYNLGLALLELGRYSEAESEFAQALKQNEYDHEVNYGLGKAIEMQGRLTEAKNLYERSRNLKPNFAPALIGLASVNLKMGQYRSAENHATTALKIEPMSIESNLILTEAYFEQDNFQAAYAQLQSSRHLAGREPEYYLLLGKVTYARRMYQDALDALDASRSLGMSNYDVFLYLGLTTYALEDYEESEKYLKLAVFKDNEEPLAWRELGRTYIKNKEWDEAADAFTKALSLDSADTESILGASFVMLNRGQFDEALENLEALEKRSDAPAMTFYYLGHAYMRSSDFTEARRSFEEFLSVWKGDTRLIEEVSGILSSLSE